MHNGVCYPNESYFYNHNIRPENVMCVLPGSTLNGGEWVAPSGSSVNCSTNPLRCNVVSSPANISLYIPTGHNIPSSNDGLYKCCLPTSCSDPNTNTITVNIFSKCSHCTVSVYLCHSCIQTISK